MFNNNNDKLIPGKLYHVFWTEPEREESPPNRNLNSFAPFAIRNNIYDRKRKSKFFSNIKEEDLIDCNNTQILLSNKTHIEYNDIVMFIESILNQNKLVCAYKVLYKGTIGFINPKNTTWKRADVIST